MLPIRTIFHPTDFSDHSQAAFELACALARDYSAALVVVHVIPPTRVYAPDGIAVPFPAEEPYEARIQLERLHPADLSLSVDHKLLEGDPTTKILELVSEVKPDLIVMGTHGATGLTRLLMGSVAENVMRKAPCPVLTVRGRFHVPIAGAPVAAGAPAG